MQERRIRAALPAAGEDGLKIQRHVGVVMGQRDANPRQAHAHRRRIEFTVPRAPCDGDDILPSRDVYHLARKIVRFDFERSLTVAQQVEFD